MRVGRKTCSGFIILVLILMLYYSRFTNRAKTGDKLPQIQAQTVQLPHEDLHRINQSPARHLPLFHLNSARRSLSKEPSYGVQRYMLSLNYWEQLTMGIRNLFSLACLGELWNMSVVQPFTYNSRLYGLPSFKPDNNMNSTRRAEKLELIFNMYSLNRALGQSKINKLSLFKSFVELAHREVTVIHFVARREIHELPVLTKGTVGHTLQAAFKQRSVVDCKALLPDYVQLITGHLNEEVDRFSLESLKSYPNFKIINYFCVNMSVLTTPESLASDVHLGPSDDNGTVIIVNWRGIATESILINTARGAHTNNRIAINSTCRDKKLAAHQSNILHSSLVIKTAQLFLKDLRLSGVEYAGVHIRSEKMGLREPRYPNSFRDCLKKLSVALKTMAANKPNLKFVYITDYGPYRSDTCKHCRSGERILKWLLKRGDHQLQFDPLKYHLPADSGLTAAVEANILVSARYLFVCGGGSFQKQVVTRFLKKHEFGEDNKSIFKVCTDDSDL